MSNNRTKAVLKNSIVGILGQLITKLLGFISRTIFIQQLGIVYLGLNGLFSNILSILSLAELGIGSAIIFSLYKPLAEKNEILIKSLMDFYAKIYKIIGLVIFGLGISIMPLIDFFIKEKPDISNLYLIYILFLINTVLSYFFAHNRSIFSADQKNYINVIYDNIFNLIMVILQIIILLLTSNFILYLIIQIICIFLSNVFISLKANKRYPYIKSGMKYKIPKPYFKEIKKNIYSMFMLKTGAVVVNGTDNLLISSYVGIASVGVYSNYIMIISILQSIITQIFTSVTASVGNLVSLESKEKSLDVFNRIFYMNFLIYGFVCINLFIFLNPFINLWIGNEYTFSKEVVFIIVLNIYLMGIRRSLWVYTNALGLFYNFRFIPFIEASVNLISSILLINILGITGVFIGTTLSTLSTYFFFEPYVLFKKHFNTKLYNYFTKYFMYLFSTLIAGTIVYTVTYFAEVDTWLGIFFVFILSTIIILATLILFTFRSKEFKYFKTLIKQLTGKLG
jgi:O-antigen/teichoic acid export membrane protein